MVKVIEMIARREGFGDLLALGSHAAAAQIGRDTEAFLITGKGLEAPAHMPQVKRALGVIYAVNPFGADHCPSEHDLANEDGGYVFNADCLKPLGLTDPQREQSLTKEKVHFAVLTQHNLGRRSMTTSSYVNGT